MTQTGLNPTGLDPSYGRRRVSPVQEHLDALHREYAGLRDGAVATYIPELAKANPDWFAICITTDDGKIYQTGDAAQSFTIQSISKALVFGLALEDNSWESVLQKVGVEPSGDSFNAIVFDEKLNRPFNPMVNAGAIATTSLVKADTLAERNHRIVDFIGRFAGRPLEVDEDVYRSERETGHRNRAIAHLMRNFDMLPDDVDGVLDAYFRQCSILVDCRDLSVIAATLANGGVNPLTGERLLSAFHVRCVLSVMSTCGMYDYAGQWAYQVGMPAKSGVSGGIVAVLPGQLGIGVFSPRVDAKGNTVRGIRVCEATAEQFGLHQYDTAPYARSIIRSERRGDSVSSRHLRPAYEREYLMQAGHCILILELQGQMFFGSMERLLRHLEDRLDGVSHLILDFSRVTGLAAHSLLLLANLKLIVDHAGVELLVSGAGKYPEVAAAVTGILCAQAADFAMPAGLSFHDMDEALEYAEQALIAIGPPALRSVTHYGLKDIDLFKGLSSEELKCLEKGVLAISFAAGETIFREGDPAQVFFALASGAVSVLRRVPGDDHGVRLASIGPGVAFGEMALLDQGTRSADVRADAPSLCYVLSMKRLEEISLTHPGIQLQIVRNMAQQMSNRLRRVNQEFTNLMV